MGYLQAITGVCQEELEGIGIRVAGVNAGSSFNRKPLLKESHDVRRIGVMAAFPSQTVRISRGHLGSPREL
jgi:hypothetical protein